MRQFLSAVSGVNLNCLPHLKSLSVFACHSGVLRKLPHLNGLKVVVCSEDRLPS